MTHLYHPLYTVTVFLSALSGCNSPIPIMSPSGIKLNTYTETLVTAQNHSVKNDPLIIPKGTWTQMNRENWLVVPRTYWQRDYAGSFNIYYEYNLQQWYPAVSVPFFNTSNRWLWVWYDDYAGWSKPISLWIEPALFLF